MKNKLIIFSIVSGCLVVIAEGVILYATYCAIGVSADSINYIKVARNIISGHGLTISSGVPLTHFPPLYPAFLAISGLIGLDPIDGARWLHVFLFAANVLIILTIIYRGTNGSIIAPVFGALFIISSASMLRISLMAWSDPLFILLTLGGFFLLSEYLSNPHKISLLIISSLFIGFAWLTRYIGVAGVVAASLSILLLSNGKTYQKLKYACIYGAMSSLPLMFWISRNRLVAGNLTDRTLKYHPVNLNHIDQGITTVAEWLLLPENLSPVTKNSFVILFICLLISGSFLLYLKQKKGADSSPAKKNYFFPIISITFLGVYLLILVISISFFDANIPFDNRILSPLFPLGIILLFSLAFNKLISLRKGWLNFFLILFLAGLLTYQTKMTLSPLRYIHENGIGFTNKDWQTSNILKIVRTLPNNITLYSNAGEIIELWTHNKALNIPALENPGTAQKNKKFDAQLQTMTKNLATDKGLLIYFNVIGRPFLPTSEYLYDNLPLQIIYDGQDGKIYQYQKKALK